MEFWASCEVYQPATKALSNTSKIVAPYLIYNFDEGILKELDLRLRYIPIVMPVEWHDKYTARSRAHIKKKVYDCAPQLEYNIFISDDVGGQIREYLRGLEEVSLHLKKFGGTPEHISEFNQILAAAVSQLGAGVAGRQAPPAQSAPGG
jgi:hypothetical protein